MSNVNIQINSRTYGKASHRNGYRGLSANIEFDGVKRDQITDISGKNPITFIESALDKIVSSAIANEDTAHAIAIALPAEITISAGLQTHIIDKYTADSFIESVTFS